MADGIDITPGSGKTVLTDDTGAGGHAQIVKLGYSADGSATLLGADVNGLDVDVTRMIPGTGSAALGKQESGAFTTGDTGVLMLGVNTSAEYRAPQLDPSNRMYVSVVSDIPGTSATALGKAEDAVHASGDTGVMILGVRKDTAAATAGTDGDYQPPIFDSTGRMWVAPSDPNVTAAGLGKAEDAVHASGDTGVMMLGVRKDTAVALAGTDGDYQPPIFDANGKLHVVNSAVSASGTITTQNLVPAGTATASSAVEITLVGAATLSMQVTGTYTGALSLQATIDGTNWITLGGVPLLNINTGVTSATITTATVGIFQADVAAFTKARLTGLAAMSGTATVTLSASNSNGAVTLAAPLPVGANVVGAISTVTTLTGTTTLTPGTAATSLGKAEDAVAASGDTGVFVLGVSRATPASTNSGAADYSEMPVSINNGLFVAPTPMQVRVTVTPTISNAAIYASGDVVGAALTITSAASASGRAGRILGATLRDLGKQSAALEAWIFLVSPTLVNADNGVFDTTDTNLSTAIPIGVIDFTTGNYRATNSNSVCMGITANGGIDIPFVTSGSANLFCALVTRGTPTYTSTADLIIEFTIQQY